MENLIAALQVTVLGMGLVFGAILALWLIMAALVRLAPGEPEAPASPPAGPPPARLAARQQAAAAAVAVALAGKLPAPPAFPALPASSLSAWGAVMRGRQLKQRGPVR